LSGKKYRLPRKTPRCQALSANCLCPIIWPDINFFFRPDFHRLFRSVFWLDANICGGSALILAEMCHIIESNDNQGDFSCKIEMHQNVIPVFLL
jgi:hypothetical protein